MNLKDMKIGSEAKKEGFKITKTLERDMNNASDRKDGKLEVYYIDKKGVDTSEGWMLYWDAEHKQVAFEAGGSGYYPIKSTSDLKKYIKKFS